MFSYEKQNSKNIIQYESGSSNKRAELSVPIQRESLLHESGQDEKLNFFQKVSNFISESITDRKHHDSAS